MQLLHGKKLLQRLKHLMILINNPLLVQKNGMISEKERIHGCVSPTARRNARQSRCKNSESQTMG